MTHTSTALKRHLLAPAVLMQDVIDRILAHLESKEQNTPTLPHLAPPTRASPETLPLFAGTEFHQQGRH